LRRIWNPGMLEGEPEDGGSASDDEVDPKNRSRVENDKMKDWT
jgi:hypothetical protein